MTELQDLIKHISILGDGDAHELDTIYVFSSEKETYDEWLAWYKPWWMACDASSPEDTFEEDLIETLGGYSLYRLVESNMYRLQCHDGTSFVLFYVDIACMY